MKNRILPVIIFSLLLSGLISCEKDKVVGEDQLPVAAKEFLDTFFIKAQVVKIEKEKDSRGMKYTVKLSDGLEVEFDESGNWMEVDAIDGAAIINTGFIIPSIIEYVNETYSNTTINGIEKKKSSYEVELNNHLELVFDLNGQFLTIDNR